MESRPFRFLLNLRRTGEIVTVLINHGFGDIVDRLKMRRYLNWGRRLVYRKSSFSDEPMSRGTRIRLTLQTLGATFVKFGQIVSTRPDLVPADVVDELEKLQEKVDPFGGDKAVEIIEASLGQPIDKLFLDFQREPLAAGSLAQVHRAKLFDHTNVAVKVRRPDVIREVERDLALMQELAFLIERNIPEAEVFDPVGLVQHFSRTIRREMNFQLETRTMEEFRRKFRNDASLHVPKVFPDFCSEAVITMEFIDGYHVDEIETSPAFSQKHAQIAQNGAHIFLKQAFEFGLFHGDPHPGNIRIMDDASICLLDYGMVGRIDEHQREQLIDLFWAIGNEDVSKGVKVILAIGNTKDDVDESLLRIDFRDFVDAYYGIPLERLNVGQMLTDFVQILTNHHIKCPPDLMMLIRALIGLEGMGRRIDPEFNLASMLLPFANRLIKNRYNPRQIASRIYSNVSLMAMTLNDMPIQVHQSLEKLNNDDLKVKFELSSLDYLITELDRSGNRIAIGMIISALILASALVIRAGGASSWISVVVLTLSSLLGIWLIYGIFRSGRL